MKVLCITFKHPPTLSFPTLPYITQIYHIPNSLPPSPKYVPYHPSLHALSQDKKENSKVEYPSHSHELLLETERATMVSLIMKTRETPLRNEMRMVI